MQVEQEFLDLHTGRSVTESNYIRNCINTFDLLMMSTCFARNMQRTEINVLYKRILRHVGHLPYAIFILNLSTVCDKKNACCVVTFTFTPSDHIGIAHRLIKYCVCCGFYTKPAFFETFRSSSGLP